MNERGCEFCGDNQNMLFGHVEQVSANDDHGVLLRCPRCGWLYIDPSDGVSAPRHILAAEASERFGFDT